MVFAHRNFASLQESLLNQKNAESFYLDEAFRAEYLEWVAQIRSDEYYVNMMIAWYFATALAKQYDATISYIQEGRLDKWTHNKAIQKAIESYRVTEE